MIWNHPTQGIWGSNKWSTRAQVTTFVLDHPLQAELDTQRLTVGSLVLGHHIYAILGVEATLGAHGTDWQTIIEDSYDP